MSDLPCSEKLRCLSDDYYNQRITQEEYRSQRKIILDDLDAKFNPIKTESSDDPAEKSMLSKAISFFKKDDVEYN